MSATEDIRSISELSETERTEAIREVVKRLLSKSVAEQDIPVTISSYEEHA